MYIPVDNFIRYCISFLLYVEQNKNLHLKKEAIRSGANTNIKTTDSKIERFNLKKST